MLANFHTHTTFCDGVSAPEEIVLSAIDKGFDALGFSGHGYIPFGLDYCMRDTRGYISEIRRLQEKYKGKIQIYLGAEEDMLGPVNRGDFDYIIGSSHHFCMDGKYYCIDTSRDSLNECVDAFGGDAIKMAQAYYSAFCEYILTRKPDIVGHFDLITKFDEVDTPQFLSDPRYLKMSEEYMVEAMRSDVIFEVNTGAISRGYRRSPYPHLSLLHVLKKHGGKVMLSSDSHSADTLDFYFAEAEELLRDIGFEYVYVIHDNEFKKVFLK